MNIIKYNFINLLIITLFLFFSPPLLMLFSGLMLIIISTNNYKNKEYVFLCYLIAFILGLIIYVNSLPNFILSSDDFSSYYNNYLYFVYEKYEKGFSEYKFEFLFPLLNLFFSKIIDGNYPYLMKLGHIIINLTLLFYLLYYISKKEFLNKENFLLLICCIFIFYKLPQQLHLMRQGYACYFVLLALFSNKKSKKTIFLITGTLFHLSTPIIYLILYLINRVNNKKKFLFSALTILLTSLFLYQISKINIFFQLPFLNKLNFVINYIHSDEHVKRTILETFKALFYFYPLIFISLFFLWKKIFIKECYFLYISTIFLLSFSYLPGFAIRIYMPIFSILLGYYYFRFLILLNNKTRFIILFLIFIFININWIFFSPLYYYRYPMGDTIPLYYLDSFIEEKGSICRECLPYNSEIKNPYR